jgi:sec-independent protein translocase protein TatB
MFDIGFSELLVIAVVALIVIGPERLPKVARTAGHLFGRLQRYVNDVKADINREMELEELRKLKSQVQDAARSIEQSVSGVTRDFESGVRNVERELGEAGPSAAPPGQPVAASAGAASPAEGSVTLAELPPLAEPATGGGADGPVVPAPAPAPAAAAAVAAASPAPAAAAAPAPAATRADSQQPAGPPRQAPLPGFDQV